MLEALRPDPPLDPRWLKSLAERCADLRGGGARFEDLYLEQRLETRLVATNGEWQVEECRTDGASARWRSPSRVVLHARTGLSAAGLAELLGRHADRVALPPVRALPAAEMDPPRGWRDWAREVAARLEPEPSTIRFLHRRAALVRVGEWAPIASPPIVRVERGGERPGALLAVWGQPLLGTWLQQLAAPEPGKRWEPAPGTELPVLFSGGTAGALLHELVGHLAESDVFASGASPLAGLLGATLTATTMDIFDDPTRADLAGSFDCDDEGIAATPIRLVRAGRLEGLLCDREGAEQLGTSPGRGRRAAWNRPPVPRLSNLVISPGATPPEKLEADVDHGLVVTGIGGATVDPLSARTVLRVESGWEVFHGRRRRPLAPCELTGSVVEVLARIDPRIGADPTADWRLGWCVKNGSPLPTGSEAPSILVERMEVL
ncbi:MAG: metallopeptidase TldD-related protein [Acidobacteriota bacterium]